MNTTNYVLELLISGISTLIWIGLLSVALWGDEVALNPENFNNFDKIFIGLASAPLIYVMGIISDRLIDSLFEKVFNLRVKYFQNLNTYREARSKVYIKSETLTNLFEYGRMRIRICRNWTVNGIFILTTALLLIWSEKASRYIENHQTRIEISIAFSLFMVLSVIASFSSWKELNKKEFRFLKIQHDIFDREANPN